MKFKNNKIKITILMTLITLLLLANFSFGFWFIDEKEDNFKWINKDFSFPKGTWLAIDEDGDGFGYNYYFDDKGGLLIDTITPDLKIVDWTGKEVNYDGEPIVVEVKKEVELNLDGLFDTNNVSAYSEEILSSIQETAIDGGIKKGFTSSGQSLMKIADPEDPNMPKPSDFITGEDLTGGKGYILGKNVVLKEARNRYEFDGTMNRDVSQYIIDGNKYSKGVKGTIFTNAKWTDCVSLKGNEASITVENPKNNFNTLSGKIAMIKTTSTDRTTECELSIVNPNTEEVLYYTNEFNYNGGVKFKIDFPRKLEKVRFDLVVTGQYQTRTCYLKDLKFGFNKETWIDEQYQDEIEEEYRRLYRDLISFENEEVNETEYETDENGDIVDNSLGEVPADNTYVGPDVRFKMDESKEAIIDDTDPDELEQRILEELEKLNSVSGPAFHKDFVATQSSIVGPDGSRNMISGTHEGDD